MSENKIINNFFITGLPRSRTAWFSAFFTGNNSFCYHEIIRVSNDFESVIDKLTNRKEMYVGNSDSSLPIWMDKIDHILRDSPIVIIERDIEEVSNSLKTLYKEYDYTKILDLTLERLEVVKKRYNYISVDYNDLDHQTCLEDIWSYCIPNIPFDKDKFETLRTINISIDYKSYMKELFNKNKYKLKQNNILEGFNK